MIKKIETFILEVVAIAALLMLASGFCLALYAVITWFIEALTWVFKAGCMVFAIGLVTFVIHEVISVFIED